MIQFSAQSASSGPENMSRDIELLRRTDNGLIACRIYSWDGSWVSLGRHQNPAKVLRTGTVPFVMRPTGGKAVLHGHDITIGLAMPLDVLGLAPTESRSVTPVYQRISSVIVDSLTRSGIPSALGEALQNQENSSQSADCFASVSRNDIIELSTAKKICGCALKLTPTAVLLQASIPVRPPLLEPSSIFADASEPYWVALETAPFASVFYETLVRSASKGGFVS